MKKFKHSMPCKTENKKRKMIVLHKRQITAASLLILVGIAGYLNWSFQKNAIDPEVTAVYNEVTKKIGEAQMVSTTPDKNETNPINDISSDYFSQARLERDIKRSESMDMLTNILHATETDKESRTRAEDEIHMLTKHTENEVMIENLIRSKGYRDVVCFMGENLVSIAVKSNMLNEVDIAVLQDIVSGTSGYPVDKIKIIEIE